ncbi:IBR domain [Musa troglodytarum]|uniref:RBR-type E3 ubiquitin transferase n=1 Tax=Musa troglodytarum TaxID=320322 RepID=A0A9E7K603_9LILI|nr:IBR domain [Musa troglodytarum]
MDDDDYYFDESDGDYGGSSYSLEEDHGDDLNDLLVEEPVEKIWTTASVISAESLLAAQKEVLQNVMSLLLINEQQARSLLIHYRWNVQKVSDYFERKGKEPLFQEAGVVISDDRDLDMLGSSTAVITCNVCFEDVAVLDATKMDCGHFFCNDCWTQNFIIRIKDGERTIRCMDTKCNAICDDVIIRNLVSQKDPCLAERLERFLLESYVEDNDNVKWCPSNPHCGNAIQVDGNNVFEVECICGFQFCFNCSHEAHSPCSCQMWKLWVQKCGDEAGTTDWIMVNTKPCPNWLCGGACGAHHTWNTITGHTCNGFTQEEEVSFLAVKQRLHRYLHYFDRYMTHADSLKKENALSEHIQRKISILENNNSAIKDYSWVLDGLRQLLRSRRVLKYTYPLAFYIFGDELFKDKMTPEEKEIKRHLFEDLQQQLETNVERLSMYVEKDFYDLNEKQVMELKLQVVNLNRVVNKFCGQMYKYIEDDLFEPMRHAAHRIAPYSSGGPKMLLQPSSSGNSGVKPNI